MHAIKTWTVHRGDALWGVEAPDLVTAVERASPEYTRAPTCGEQDNAKREGVPVRKPSKRLHDWNPTRQGELFSAAILGYVPGALIDNDESVLVVHVSDNGNGNSVIVNEVREDDSALSSRNTLQLALACIDARALADAQRPRYITVPLFKSGKREGQPRFEKKHTADVRRRVAEDIEHNAMIETDKLDRGERLIATLDVLIRRVAIVMPTTLAEVAGLRAGLETLRDGMPYSSLDGRDRDWVAHELARCDRQRRRLESVQDHGFGPGTHCTVTRSRFWEEGDAEPAGVCTISVVQVEECENTYSPGTRVQHLRIMVDARGREWTFDVERLRLQTTEVANEPANTVA